jgi:hypothetical protein
MILLFSNKRIELNIGTYIEFKIFHDKIIFMINTYYVESAYLK